MCIRDRQNAAENRHAYLQHTVTEKEYRTEGNKCTEKQYPEQAPSRLKSSVGQSQSTDKVAVADGSACVGTEIDFFQEMK